MYIIYFSYLYIFTPDCRILLILELFQDTVEIKQTIKTGKSLNESEVEPVAIHLKNGCLMNSAAKRTKLIDEQPIRVHPETIKNGSGNKDRSLDIK